MNSINMQNLVKTLWTPFLGEIQSHRPVVFCYHKDLVVQLFQESKINFGDAFGFINEAVRQLVVVESDMVLLKPEALLPVWNDISSSIILVCQQILTVEEMSKDHFGFSEHAYFPRLRSVISDELVQLSQNPFSFDDFEDIWRRFKDDIILLGGSSSSVTFRFGESYGRDKARAFPLSQALLSSSDVHTLIRSIGKEALRRAERQTISRMLYTNKTTVSRRGQRLLSLPWLKESLIDQVSAHLQDEIKEMAQSSQYKSASSERYDIFIFKDNIDIYTSAFTAVPFSEGRKFEIEHAIFCEKIRSRLRSKGFFFLPRTDVGDAWMISDGRVWVNNGDDLLILGLPSQIDNALDIVEKMLKCKLEIKSKTYLNEVSGLSLIELGTISDAKESILIQGGLILVTTEEEMDENYYWVGGLPIQRSNGRYHHEYPPTHLFLRGETIELIGSVEINECVNSFEQFFESLKTLVGQETFRVKIRDFQEVKMQIAGQPEEPGELVGYHFDGTLGLVPTTLGKAYPCLQGFSIFNRIENDQRVVREKLLKLWEIECADESVLEDIKICEISQSVIERVMVQGS